MSAEDRIRPCGVTPPTDEFAGEIEVAEAIYRSTPAQEDREALWHTYQAIADLPEAQR